MTYQYSDLQNENLDGAITPTKEYRKLLQLKEKKAVSNRWAKAVTHKKLPCTIFTFL